MTKRIAISLPDDLYKRMERVRRSRRVPRSRLVQEAIGDYVGRTDEAELERAYFEGYRRFPDDDEDFRAMERAAIEDMRKRGD
jgi:metal-responsive CopG/Arc/MetJ family transcriptional regulator